MKTSLLILCTLIFTSAQAQTPTWQWAKRTGSSGDNISSMSGNEAIYDVKVDKIGNIYSVGNFYPNTAFQNAQLFGQTTPLGFGQEDAYLMKYNSCGQLLWWRRMGGTNVDGSTSVLIDKAGNVVVTGYSFSSPSIYSGGANTISINNTISNGPQFIAKFDTNGTLLNVYTYPYDYTRKILQNSQGNYIITNGLSAANINSLGIVTSTIAFIIPTPFYPGIIGISIDKNDNFYLTGAFINTVNIGPGTTLTPSPSTLITNSYAGNSLLMKFNSAGIMEYYQRSFWNSLDQLLDNTLDTSGTSIFVGGRNWNNAGVFGYTLSSGVGNYVNPIYRFNANTGTPISVVTGSTNGAGWLSPKCTDRDNNIHCYGRINGYLSFNNSTITAAGPSGNFQNIIGKLNYAGNFNSFYLLPQVGSNPGRDWIYGMDVSEQGNVYVGGMFGGTLDSAGTAVNIIGGQEDGFVAKFGFPCGSTLTALSPLAPTSLIAVYQGSLSNVINWVDNSNYETGYELWYNGPTPTFSLLSTLPPNTTSYTHTALNYSTTYCYAARALNNIGPSVYTNTDCATTPAMVTPQAPTNLVALNTGSLINTVNWVDNSFDETGFELWYHDASPTFSLLATMPANTTTYTHTNLSYTTTYCYKALATNSIGPSAFTNSDCATTPQAPLPDAPTNLTALNTGTLENNINWIDNSNNETSFELWYHDASPSFSLLATLPANTTTYTHTNLSYTTTYCYKALATNSVGSSAFTNTDCASTPAELIDETGIAKNAAAAGITIYPNPSKGVFFIEFSSGIELVNLKVSDAIGRVVKEEQISTITGSNIYKLILPANKGLYFLQITSAKGTVLEKLVIE